MELLLKPEVVERRLARARLALGKGIDYHLGRGGFRLEHADDPGWDHGCCDCSGFVSWVLETRRSPKAGRPLWIETTAVARDASGDQEVFARLNAPWPGCLSVYGDSGGHQGHIGIVTSASMDGDGTVVQLRGIDCSLGSYWRSGDAIQERDLTRVFAKNDRTVYCCLKEDLV